MGLPLSVESNSEVRVLCLWKNPRLPVSSYPPISETSISISFHMGSLEKVHTQTILPSTLSSSLPFHSGRYNSSSTNNFSPPHSTSDLAILSSPSPHISSSLNHYPTTSLPSVCLYLLSSSCCKWCWFYAGLYNVWMDYPSWHNQSSYMLWPCSWAMSNFLPCWSHRLSFPSRLPSSPPCQPLWLLSKTILSNISWQRIPSVSTISPE